MSLHIHLGHAFRSFGNKLHHAFDELENDTGRVFSDHAGEIKQGLEAGAKAAFDHAPAVFKGVIETVMGNPAGIVEAVEAAVEGTKEVVQDTKVKK